MAYKIVKADNGELWVEGTRQKGMALRRSQPDVLRKMKKTADRLFGRARKPRPVITVPAYFTTASARQPKTAGRIAGLRSKGISPTSPQRRFGLWFGI